MLATKPWLTGSAMASEHDWHRRRSAPPKALRKSRRLIAVLPAMSLKAAPKSGDARLCFRSVATYHHSDTQNVVTLLRVCGYRVVVGSRHDQRCSLPFSGTISGRTVKRPGCAGSTTTPEKGTIAMNMHDITLSTRRPVVWCPLEGTKLRRCHALSLRRRQMKFSDLFPSNEFGKE